MNLSKSKIVSLGIQHVLAMYAGAVIVPLIVGAGIGLTGEQLTYLVSIDIMMCGIATFLQVYQNKFFGIGLPVVLGCTFTAVGPIIAIGNQYSVGSIYGAIIASGLIVVVISKYFSKLVKFFPPVVTGSVVTVIGVTLIPVAMNNLAGGQGSSNFGAVENVLLGFGTLLFILAIFRFFNGFIRSIAILLGILAGTLAASFMGMVDFSAVKEASWFHLPKLFFIETPEFHIMPIVTMTLVAIVSLVESTGVYFALSDICEKKINEHDIARGYRSEGIAIVLGGIFNAFPYTTFSQNVGLLQLSGVKSKNIIYTAAGMLVLLGLVPKIGAFTTIIPSSVLGGAMVAMFGMVIASGIKMLGQVDFSSQENLLIVACSVGLGLGVTVVPEMFGDLPASLRILTDSGIVLGSLTAVLLNLVFNVLKIGQSKYLLQKQQKVS
ncbi:MULTISPECIES: nucleobase:cation symporter-2 family protein [Bacillaceae]|jgi:xanthine permease|uniref:Xanthine permease n=1 Tax=Caldibacillus thermoamylovorans TaxID=35841 RepID=A0A090J1V2_9BACI|nr:MULTISPECIES: nucleobase:cation symporter-2 family protein [Bacillaceae]MBU5342655.1 purine permease [Caldifermentibacillus hisashii]MCM3053257.1 purine permease [Caldibacillus thermoamylovorans]MCM3477072.1 purine permease [Caldibacillus thermoamylovorans]MDL0418958.1 nucleobase:cation symporter-2 family protein [Caldibacillus thermoamylovorans]MEC5271041.1 nucleobase:cation symporter-2 family protein [Caldifermentibacillus hisashii]